MKKNKILVGAVCVSMLATAIAGGTLAYFTDKEEKANEFTVGNIDIELTEEVAVLDKDGKPTADVKVVETEDGASYTNLMPTNKIVKTPTVSVDSKSNPAYVRVTVDVNNALELNQAIDEVYENLDWTAEEIQAKYDEVFEGWGINYNPRPGADGKNNARGVIEMGRRESGIQPTGTVELYNVDFTKTTLPNDTYLYSVNNMFMADSETKESYSTAWVDGTGYYAKSMDEYTIRYTYYLYMKPGDEFTLFQGLNVPADFDNNRKVGENTINQMAFFEGLNIDIKADAIQAEGFDSPEDAFEALEAAHPMQ